MWTVTIVFLCASALSSSTLAAPGPLAVGLDSVTEDLSQKVQDVGDNTVPISSQLHRKQKPSSSSETPKPVKIWVNNDFDNIGTIRVEDSSQDEIHNSISSSSSSPPPSSNSQHQNSKPPQTFLQHLLPLSSHEGFPPRQSVSEFLSSLYRTGAPPATSLQEFFSGATGTLIYIALGIVLLFFAAVAILKSMPRPYRMRMGHRRGHSRLNSLCG
ncbi:hypothetical protein CERZMDRAFT_117007 [Cercospora zeae-maydis SCOH1-5]|uniref:Uncharacterized protein n=1 Tax=Cercospora zeae-maydis SCOH1-5 TaxID=717836 RepID=A0A6A6FLF5_9PEZI|nr:hypothetical protein CERZMDRAFT_117007 [Cercospora zeae-maydis SCOH1-5]